MHGFLGRAFGSGQSAIDHEGNAALSQALVKQRAVTVSKRMVQDGGRQSIVLHEEEGVLERVGVVNAAPVCSKANVTSMTIMGLSSTIRIDRP